MNPEDNIRGGKTTTAYVSSIVLLKLVLNFDIW